METTNPTANHQRKKSDNPTPRQGLTSLDNNDNQIHEPGPEKLDDWSQLPKVKLKDKRRSAEIDTHVIESNSKRDQLEEDGSVSQVDYESSFIISDGAITEYTKKQTPMEENIANSLKEFTLGRTGANMQEEDDRPKQDEMSDSPTAKQEESRWSPETSQTTRSVSAQLLQEKRASKIIKMMQENNRLGSRRSTPDINPINTGNQLQSESGGNEDITRVVYYQ